MNMDEIQIEVAPRNGKPQRVVIARFGESGEHRSSFDSDSAISRERFLRQLASKVQADPAELIGRFDQRIIELADEADESADKAADDQKPDSGEEREQKSQATALVEMALAAGVILFHDPDQNAYVRFPVKGHWEIARANSSSFKRWLSRLYFDEIGKAPNSQAKADAVGVLEGKAIFDGDEHAVFVRVAQHCDSIYLDLCNDSWEVVEIGAGGWRVMQDPPIYFRRVKAMLSLPTPIAGGSVGELRRFIHATDESFVLAVAWLIAALRPQGPYPVLLLDGEQGSGKTTTARMLRRLVDPNTADMRSEPREPRDLMIAANNGHVIALDNLSSLPAWLSDCLCRLATGGGFSTRTLYENDEETIFAASRPTTLNGIEQVASRGDLIDRALLLSLLAIPEDERKPEAKLWAEFDAARPAILGALLTVVSGAIRNLPTTHLRSLPRMADFATWISAAETGLGWPAGSFLAAYTGNREEADRLTVESSVIGKWLLEFLEEHGEWQGIAQELLAALEGRAGLADAKNKPKGWPASARGLSGALKRLAPNLRRIGWETESSRDSGRNRDRRISIRKLRRPTVQTVRTVHDGQIDAKAENSRLRDADGSAAETLDDGTEFGGKRTATDGSDGRSLAQPEPFNRSERFPCQHDWRDEPPQNGRIRTSCARCDQFYGYRPAN